MQTGPRPPAALLRGTDGRCSEQLPWAVVRLLFTFAWARGSSPDNRGVRAGEWKQEDLGHPALPLVRGALAIPDPRARRVAVLLRGSVAAVRSALWPRVGRAGGPGSGGGAARASPLRSRGQELTGQEERE